MWLTAEKEHFVGDKCLHFLNYSFIPKSVLLAHIAKNDISNKLLFYQNMFKALKRCHTLVSIIHHFVWPRIVF